MYLVLADIDSADKTVHHFEELTEALKDYKLLSAQEKAPVLALVLEVKLTVAGLQGDALAEWYKLSYEEDK